MKTTSLITVLIFSAGALIVHDEVMFTSMAVGCALTSLLALCLSSSGLNVPAHLCKQIVLCLADPKYLPKTLSADDLKDENDKLVKANGLLMSLAAASLPVREQLLFQAAQLLAWYEQNKK